MLSYFVYGIKNESQSYFSASGSGLHLIIWYECCGCTKNERCGIWQASIQLFNSVLELTPFILRSEILVANINAPWTYSYNLLVTVFLVAFGLMSEVILALHCWPWLEMHVVPDQMLQADVQQFNCMSFPLLCILQDHFWCQ
jgi:hypothetical protein